MHAPDFTPPNEIDGTPREVARASLEQVVLLADWLEDVVRETTTMVRGAVLTTRLNADPEAPADELNEAWDTSVEGRAMEALAQRAAAVSAGASAATTIIK